MSFPGNLSLPVQLGCLWRYIQVVGWIGRCTDCMYRHCTHKWINGLIDEQAEIGVVGQTGGRRDR
jgi:hypothetical protein